MNNHVKDYIEKRIAVNKSILLKVRKKSTKILLENAITELEGVLEVVNLVQSRTSKEPNLKEDEQI